jgi:lipid II:glycine glycyltransferase (peptidoglycan interpeptide bridge formation enzyme)
MRVSFINYEWKNCDPIYCNPVFLETEGDSYGWIAGYENEKIILLVPFTLRSKWGIKIAKLQMEPYSFGAEVTESQEKLFLKYCLERLSEQGIAFCEQPPPHAIFRVYPDGAIAARFGSYILDLKDRTEHQLWLGLNPKHRNVILNAQKKGVTIKSYEGAPLEYIHQILSDTMQKSSMNFISIERFKKLIISLENNIEILVAYDANKIIGCGIFIWSQYSAYYLFGGVIPNPILGSMNLLLWEAINRFREKGVDSFDFVGARISPAPNSKLEGIQRFKKRFGAKLHEGFLWKYPMTYKYYIYSLLQRVKTRGIGDIIDQEGRGSND